MLVVIIVIPVLAPGAGAASKYKTLSKFSGGKDGKFPQASLIFGQAGNLYGTTAGGGTHQWGIVFQLVPNLDGRWTKKVIHRFTGRPDGAGPEAGLTFDQAGNLYGTTSGGGVNNFGTVFKLAPNSDGSWTESLLYSFTGRSDGGTPLAGLIFDQAGNLYGTTLVFESTNIGTVFKLTPNRDGSWTESVLYRFCSVKNCLDGDGPRAGLTFDQAGNLYGTTELGGVHLGTVFKLTPHSNGSWTESVLYGFTDGRDGGRPVAGVIFDQNGNLYGTATEGGDLNCNSPSGCGVVFQLTPSLDGSWTESVLHRFTGEDGRAPLGELTFDNAGSLYGTTQQGGSVLCGYGCGIVFKLAPDSNGGWKETVLHAFADHPGAYPDAGVVLDTSGDLYGTATGDFHTTFGSVFEIMP